MTSRPSFVRCPYCRRKLDREPKRKINCPHCGQPIYVRNGRLMREEQLAEASTKRSKRKPTNSSKAASTPKAASRRKPQGQLAADLQEKKQEQYTPKDLLAGLQLLMKIAGVLIAGGRLGQMLSSLFKDEKSATQSSAGIATLLQGVDTEQLLSSISEAYTSLNEEERFQMRAVVAWLQNGFQLPLENEAQGTS